jgi:xanthine/uracil permease
VPPYALPLALIAAILAMTFGTLVYAVRNWPLPKIVSGRVVSMLGLGLVGAIVLVWGMAAKGDWTPPDTAATTLGFLVIPLLAVLFAGGEADLPNAPAAAARPRAGHERGVFPLQPAADPPRTGTPTWALLAAFVLFGFVIAGCTFAVLQSAGWLRP